MRWLWGLILAASAYAATPGAAQGWCEQGNHVVTINGTFSTSTTVFMQSYPRCIVTVYLTGTLTLATIYADSASTPKANPFSSDVFGHWFFFAASSGVFDVRLSGGGLAAPYTVGGVGVGGGGIDIGHAPVAATFTAGATSGTVTHNFSNASHILQCQTQSTGAPVMPARNGLGLNSDTPTFPGGLVVNTTCIASLGGGSVSPVSATFSLGATSGTITHNFSSSTHIVQCQTVATGAPVLPAVFGKGSNSDTPTFPGGLSEATTCVASL